MDNNTRILIATAAAVAPTVVRYAAFRVANRRHLNNIEKMEAEALASIARLRERLGLDPEPTSECDVIVLNTVREPQV